MSTDAQTTRARLPHQGPPAGPAQGADPAGQLLRRLTVLPALLVLAWLLAGLPLLLLGVFRPVLMLVASVPLAAGLVLAGCAGSPRPGRRTRPACLIRPGPRSGPGRPWWALSR